jgi:hypothetical protein
MRSANAHKVGVSRGDRVCHLRTKRPRFAGENTAKPGRPRDQPVGSMPPSATLALLLAAGGAALRLGAASDPTAACAAKLDAWCGNESNPALSVCYKSMRATKVKIPLVAAYSGQSGAPTERKWRCYSPTDLKTDPSTTPVMQRSWTAGPDYCSDSVPLEALLRECDPSWTPPPPPPCPPSQRCPSMVFAGGAIPSLVFVPAAAAAAESAEGNGTLIAFSEYAAKCPGDPTATCSLGAKRSTDGGASWSAAAFPVDEATQLPSPGSHSNWCCPQSLWDPATKSVCTLCTCRPTAPHIRHIHIK